MGIKYKIAAYVYPDVLKMPTGVSMLTLNMVKVLAKNPEVELRLLASRCELTPDGTLPRELGLAGIPVIPLPWKRSTREALWLATNTPVIDHYLPEDFWIYSSMETYVAARRRRRIVTVHHLEPPRQSPLLSRQVYRTRTAAWRLRKAITSADLVITQSTFTRGQVAERFGVPLDRMAVVGSGASSEMFAAQTDVALDGLVPDFRPYLLVAGAMDHRKGSDYLISLAKELQTRKSPLKIVCTAGTYGNPDYIAAARQQPNMVLLSFVSSRELLAYMRRAVCFLCLSRLEGFGLPMIEAMAAGLPVVAAATSAIPETLGGTGVLVNPADTRQVVEAVKRIQSDAAYRENLVIKGCARVTENFTWDACMRRLLSALN
jgi:alpha-1,3-rhamnosyl/mannosyltransferase